MQLILIVNPAVGSNYFPPGLPHHKHTQNTVGDKYSKAEGHSRSVIEKNLALVAQTIQSTN